ncbi:MAG: hypothetical protein WA888_01515 [Burkholderiaceae bacterium]
MRSKIVLPAGITAMSLAPYVVADTTDVKTNTVVEVMTKGVHCEQDPNCFNRYYPAFKPVARAKSAGGRLFKTVGSTPLQVLIDNGSHLLAAREDLSLEHAYLIVSSLLENADTLHLKVPLSGRAGIAVHLGARAAELGEKLELLSKPQ